MIAPPGICRAWAFSALCLLGAVSSGASAQTLLIRTPQTSASYDTVLDAMRARLHERIKVEIELTDGATSAAEERADLVVALGTEANEQVVDSATAKPLFSLLLPQSRFQALNARFMSRARNREHSGLYLDQSLAIQTGVATRVFPRLRQFGLLYSSPTYYDEQSAASLSVIARTHEYEGNLTLSLRGLLRDIDALVAIPDPEVFNELTAHTVLLTAYRMNKPVIGYSRSYVSAGALIAAYTPPADLGAEAGVMIDQWLRSGRRPAPRHPTRFAISVNERVAEVLGLTPAHLPNPLETYTGPEEIR